LTSKVAFSTTLGMIAAAVVLVVAFHMVVDPYGLFHDMKGQQRSVVMNERIEKHLLSYNYVPANFNALMIGPSLSDNLDTSLLTRYRVYNLSLNAGNATEIKVVLDSALNHGRFDALIICLHPYLTKDHGLKTSALTEQDIYSSLGSLDSFKYFVRRISMHLAHDPGMNTPWGQFKYHQQKKHRSVAEMIAEEVKKAPTNRVNPQPEALADLAAIIQRAHQEHIKVFAYFHPTPYPVFMAYQEDYLAFKQAALSLLTKDDVVWDYLDEAHRSFTEDLANYHDHQHLSAQGVATIVADIQKHMEGAWAKP